MGREKSSVTVLDKVRLVRDVARGLLAAGYGTNPFAIQTTVPDRVAEFLLFDPLRKAIEGE